MATKYKMPTIDIGTYDTLPQWKKNQMDKLKKKTSPGEPKLNKKKKIEPKVEKPKVKIETKETKKAPPKEEKKRPWWKPLTSAESKARDEKRKKERKAKSDEAKSKAYKKKTEGPMTYGEKEKAKRSARDFKRPAAATQSQYATELVDVKPGPATIPGQKTRRVKTEKTKGGEYPYGKPGSETASSFNKTFRNARNPKSGKMAKTFTWQGRSYSTRQAGEGKSFDAATGKWGKAAKKQMGGPIGKGPIMGEKPFKQGIKYYEGGGQVTVSNDKAGTGDVVHTHSHSGYKAGK